VAVDDVPSGQRQDDRGDELRESQKPEHERVVLAAERLPAERGCSRSQRKAREQLDEDHDGDDAVCLPEHPGGMLADSSARMRHLSCLCGETCSTLWPAGSSGCLHSSGGASAS